jgi:hypothetical protein
MTNILVKNQSNENFLKKIEIYIFNFILITFFKIKKSKGKMQKRASDSKKILPYKQILSFKQVSRKNNPIINR